MILSIVNALTPKKFEDFGKHMAKQRKSQVGSIGKQFKKIATKERKRVKQIFEEHKDFFKEKPESVSIDFYEK
jgi:hypothetical protein